MNDSDNIWLIRNKAELNGRKVCCDFEPLEDLLAIKSDTKNFLKKLNPEMQKARIAVNTSVVEDFAKKINIGDLAIITSNNEKKYISIVRITSDYYFDSYNKYHVRDVNPIISVSRDSLSESFRRDLRKPRAVTSLPMTPDILDVINSAKKVSLESDALKAVFPLRQDFSININIPHDMSKLEAERLAEFVRTLWQVK